jgi:hypothetical protein
MAKKLTVKKDEAAIVLSNNRIDVYIPETKENDLVPAHVQIIVAIAVLLESDNEFIEYIHKKWENLMLHDIPTSINTHIN